MKPRSMVHVSPLHWLQKQIKKCDELLADTTISDDNRRLVEALRRDFQADVVKLEGGEQPCCTC